MIIRDAIKKSFNRFQSLLYMIFNILNLGHIMKKLFLLLGLGASLLCTQIHAKEFFFRNGFYLGGYVGGNYINKTKMYDPNLNRNVDLRWNTGLIVTGSVGYEFCNCMRIEEEFGYHYNAAKGPHHQCFEEHPRAGHYQVYAAMTNIFFEFCRLPCIFAKPYVGVGVGYAYNRIKNENVLAFNGHNSTLAWQGLAGISYPFGPRYDFTCDFRYFCTRLMRHHNHHLNTYSLGIGLKRFF
jgi:opacity protein-like surface antigen